MNAHPGFRVIACLILAALLAGLSACSGSGNGPVSGTASASACIPGDASTSSECGKLLVTFTDAEGDFTSYTVDVLSIALERPNGSRIEMLPAAARIDFAQLSSLSELIAAATVVPGDIVGGHIVLDYSDAEIYVESGGEIVPAEVYDGDGNRLNTSGPDSIVEVAIELPDTDRLVVTRARTVMLSIDFDLAASHVVDTSMAPVQVVAQPYLVAEILPVDDKETRVRGALVDVDLDAGTYDIRLRPWYHRAGDFGAFTVMTNDATEFEIDDRGYVGAAGLEALAGKPAGTLTVAFGTLDLSDRSFSADIVHAGDSIGGDRYSAVLGNIVARYGDQLVMKGAVAIRRDRRAHFHRTVIVTVGPETKVSRVGDIGVEFDKDDLSVGQRTMVFGTFTNATIDNSDRFGPDIALMLDATQGRARMLVTRLTGTVVAIQGGQIDLHLRAIDRLGIGMFDFSGTGTSPAFDADPANYEVATSTLPLTDLRIDRAVRVLGFVARYGAAPPDFEGRTVIGPRDLPAVLGVGWGVGGTAAPFSLMGPQELVIDLLNPDIDVRHHMLIGGEIIDLFDLPSSPILRESPGRRVYGIWEPGHIELFRNFADFVDELALRLGEANRARSLSAYGRYSEDQNDLTANKIVVHMLPAEAL